jgi:acyl-CoA reductase-like NAD-dependent aldehyde dehydrogenase
MRQQVNSVEYGLTCATFANDPNRAHRTAAEVETGYIWINKVRTHFLGAPFGGYEQSGIGREECLAELIAFTRERMSMCSCASKRNEGSKAQFRGSASLDVQQKETMNDNSR